MKLSTSPAAVLLATPLLVLSQETSRDATNAATSIPSDLSSIVFDTSGVTGSMTIQTDTALSSLSFTTDGVTGSMTIQSSSTGDGSFTLTGTRTDLSTRIPVPTTALTVTGSGSTSGSTSGSAGAATTSATSSSTGLANVVKAGMGINEVGALAMGWALMWL